jgi:hypothetical protein
MLGNMMADVSTLHQTSTDSHLICYDGQILTPTSRSTTPTPTGTTTDKTAVTLAEATTLAVTSSWSPLIAMSICLYVRGRRHRMMGGRQ